MEMSEKARSARAEYYKQWRKRNPDKVRATQERYWAKKVAEWKAEEDAMAKANEQSNSK